MIDNEKIMQNITVYAVGQPHSNCLRFFNYLLQHQYGSRLLICKMYFCSNLLFLANLYSLIVTKFTLTLYFPVIYVFRINSTLCHSERFANKTERRGHLSTTQSIWSPERVLNINRATANVCTTTKNTVASSSVINLLTLS